MKKTSILLTLCSLMLVLLTNLQNPDLNNTIEDNPQPNSPRLAIEDNPQPNSFKKQFVHEQNPRSKSYKLAIEDNPQPNSYKKIRI
ncbi:hypothetical protein IHV12_21310 [Fictibacillus sp. 7GRE50]|uniref:hypothetical protein n=1 Tax=Fictibacillus sp. 7GRE50 TaxID=2745878 RepID=UPI0018CCD4CE|nr:hypothetical protein [Fictibacillus sp. 7GRE50]MBH0167462.1 hypothetical protein [Fictibacillus sp. 7GRE50]